MIEEPAAACHLLLLLPPLSLSIVLTFFPSLSLPLSSSANLSCLAGSVFSGVFHCALSLFLPLVSDPLIPHLLPFVAFFALIYSHFQFCENFLYCLVMEGLREDLKKVIEGLQGQTKATLVRFVLLTSPQGFHAFQLLSLHQTFPSVQENQEVKVAAVK